ncbi:hypothetical protein P691DRAFT_780939 [Macrolepiota fuliginosa MF-IS2]|uniref:Uncharacterized protein n=1 Tax=Macrolepiota fuliginosa MF-IS2 TaxID=1400762 RepID=A0A9P5XMB6_9AGAR|nr:hypothetical protein P691DRAFT_780939 [Macrolepiota fuliginosa MF-IS2]
MIQRMRRHCISALQQNPRDLLTFPRIISAPRSKCLTVSYSCHQNLLCCVRNFGTPPSFYLGFAQHLANLRVNCASDVSVLVLRLLAATDYPRRSQNTMPHASFRHSPTEAESAWLFTKEISEVTISRFQHHSGYGPWLVIVHRRSYGGYQAVVSARLYTRPQIILISRIWSVLARRSILFNEFGRLEALIAFINEETFTNAYYLIFDWHEVLTSQISARFSSIEAVQRCEITETLNLGIWAIAIQVSLDRVRSTKRRHNWVNFKISIPHVRKASTYAFCASNIRYRTCPLKWLAILAPMVKCYSNALSMMCSELSYILFIGPMQASGCEEGCGTRDMTIGRGPAGMTGVTSCEMSGFCDLNSSDSE